MGLAFLLSSSEKEFRNQEPRRRNSKLLPKQLPDTKNNLGGILLEALTAVHRYINFIVSVIYFSDATLFYSFILMTLPPIIGDAHQPLILLTLFQWSVIIYLDDTISKWDYLFIYSDDAVNKI